jgi:hypothetical protein
MTLKKAIKILLDIDVSTDDINALWGDPERYTVTPEEANKVRELIKLVAEIRKREV